MKLIFLIILLVLQWFIIKKISMLISTKLNIEDFKKKVLLVPINILITIILIKLIGLSFTEAGLILGNVYKGLKSIFVFGLPLALISGGLVFTIPSDDLKEITYGEGDIKWQFIYVWIFVGPVEELLYRGFVQGALNTIVNGHLFIFSYATIIASVIFVFVHILNVLYGNETWKAFLSMVPTRFIAALVLGYSFQISKSLIYPIIIHNLIDGINLSILYYRKQNSYVDWV
ncbi:CPBP family intramembrane glutamic endopeptidase [Anoxybacter fermentans]|uniref:CPBP family intramembrane glutamic endopeptidase n=1 Tax=Anoxybacter fermentans TaxID=1323375 RepID=UPI0013DFB2B3|nr:CPBP family intramembrane glutamic endopeptidase [Anoxybacter fermentans]